MLKIKLTWKSQIIYNTSLRSEIPLLKNMMATAKNLTVISGLRIPLQI